MRAAGDMGREELAARHGKGAGRVLVEFRTSLGWPGRGVTPEQFAAVLRYRDLDEGWADVRRQADNSRLDIDDDDTFRATEKGHSFLTDLFDVQARATGARWPNGVDELSDLVGRALTAATERRPGPALGAMAPPFEPPHAPAGALLLNRLGTLRYH